MTSRQATFLRGDIQSAAGIFLLAFAIYALLGPGRIDMIDGQWRFEVAYNMVDQGSIAVLDPAIRNWGLIGDDGQRYSFYGLGGSFVALPWVALADWLAPGNRDLAQFMFSLTSPILAAATLALLFLWYRRLGFGATAASAWSLVLGFATLFFPLAVSVFDQAQNALFLFAAYAFIDLAREKQCPRLAMAGALAFAILLNFKEAYIVFLPGLLWASGFRHLADIRSRPERQSIPAIVFSGAVFGIGFWIVTNLIRFGTALPPDPPIASHPPVFGNPLYGAAILTVSPGKGILWFSPAVLIVAAGWKRFSRAKGTLSQGVLIGAGAWLLLIASLSFAGGDWCWGPRYWVPILPLLFLAAPYAPLARLRQWSVASILVSVSLAVQLLAISMDHQRYFFENQLEPFFWYRNEGIYFKDSQLLSRVRELRTLQFRNAKQNESIATSFRPGPYPSSPTYTVFGPSMKNAEAGPAWVARYPVFSLPRPWIFWSVAIGNSQMDRLRSWLVPILSVLAACGALLVIVGAQRSAK